MAALASLLMVCCLSLNGQGNLPRGPHSVGFRSYFKYDSGRPILIAIWYPATPAPTRMKYRDYLDIPHTKELGEFALGLRKYSETIAKETVFHKKVELIGRADQSFVDRQLERPSQAYRDAPATAGHFPVIINHPGAGGSFDDNVLLFEYLASHGYVVISSAYQTSTAYVSNNMNGTHRSIRDMQFLLQAVGELPYADIHKIAGLGHSAGAQILMQWIGQPDCLLDALVSLDTTLEYTPRNFPGHKELRLKLESLGRPSIPVILFASAERKPNFGTFDTYLQNAPRYQVSIPHLKHDDFISQGAARALLPDPAENVGRSYDVVCSTIKLFLDSTLKSSASATAALKASPAVRYRPPR